MSSKLNHVQIFSVKYSEEFPFIMSSHTGKYYKFCKICRQNFKINLGGRNDIVKHVSTDQHEKNTDSENAISDTSKGMMSAMFMKSVLHRQQRQRYKENFFSLRNFQRSGVIATFNKSEEMKMIRCFNQLIISITNALWRFKAHGNDDKHSILNFNPVLIDPDLANSRIEEGLSLFRHHALLPFTCSYVFKVLMEPASDVQELMPMKREFLKYLDTYNLTGISQFISSFIRSISSLGSSQ